MTLRQIRKNTKENYRSERTPLPLNLSQMSSDTEDSGGLGMSAECKEITSLGKHTDNTSKDRREEDH